MTGEGPADSPRRRIILHAGAPKTGSTSLQNFFADNPDALKADGVHYPPRFFRRGQVDPLHDMFTKLRAGNRAEEKLVAAFRARLDAMFHETGAGSLLISNESVLGEPFNADVKGFFPDHTRSIRQLVKLFEGYDVRVVYFIRDFEGFLPSYYVQYVRMGGHLTFERFCNHMGREQLSWQPVISALRKAFGTVNVMCFETEALRRAPAATAGAAFGDYIPSLPAFDAARYNQNQSVGRSLLAFYRLMNRLLENAFPIRQRRKLRPLMRQYLFEPLAYVSQLLARDGKPVPVDPPSAKQAERWRAQYRADQSALGLD